MRNRATGIKFEGSQWETMKGLIPYLWPKNRTDLKLRVVIAMLLLLASKVVTILTPYAFKGATDSLVKVSGTEVALLSVPIFMVMNYGLGRIFSVVFAQIRDAVFAKVGQRAVRELSYSTFRHLHQLSLKFHLERKTGALSRIISRGINGVDSVLRFALFNTFPTGHRNRLSVRRHHLVAGLALFARHCCNNCCLHLVHLLGHRTAHWHPQDHERGGQ